MTEAIETSETIPAPKPAAKPKKKRASVATGAKRKAAKKPAKKPAKRSKVKATRKAAKTGADRVPGQHIMSVHIPVGMMAKMDRKIAGLVRSGKMTRATRSGYIVNVIARSL